jgi:hypothetical protein
VLITKTVRQTPLTSPALRSPLFRFCEFVLCSAWSEHCHARRRARVAGCFRFQRSHFSLKVLNVLV